MRAPIRIGQKEFRYKKDAIAHYRAILNSYDFGQSLNESDFNDLLGLLNCADEEFADDENPVNEVFEDKRKLESDDEDDEDDEDDVFITDIKVSRVQFNSKCFEVFYSDNTSWYMSYFMHINHSGYTPERKFYVACRNSIHEDIRAVKQAYFDENSVKGQVKCQETGIMSKWTELVVDHRQPNTFSIIVDRFKEVYRVELDGIEYTSNDHNFIVFEDDSLTDSFKNYHKEKAKLRIVRAECNSSRTALARIKPSSKDLIIK